MIRRKRGCPKNQMHEVSIVQGMLEIAIDNCKKGGYKGIESIKVKVGKASGVLIDSMMFAFEALRTGTIAEKAILTIDEIPVSGFCDACKCDFTVQENYLITECPKCGSSSLRIDTGKELNIYEMEVSE
jgi:hydrogenase nickel incorporation protein HypA/HybF